MVKCGYCGKQSPEDTRACPGCGTELSPNVAAAAPITSTSTAGRLFWCAMGLLGLVSLHPPSIVHLFEGLFGELEGDELDSPLYLLNRAAAYEGVNVTAALALYNQVLVKHPGTRAAEEAERNIQTLLVAHPELDWWGSSQVKLRRNEPKSWGKRA